MTGLNDNRWGNSITRETHSGTPTNDQQTTHDDNDHRQQQQQQQGGEGHSESR